MADLIDDANKAAEWFAQSAIIESLAADRPGKIRCECGNRDDRIIAGYVMCEDCMEDMRMQQQEGKP